MSLDRELMTLVSKFLDECISPAEMARLQSLLAAQEMRRQFLEICNIHYGLKVATLSEQDESLARKLADVHRAIIPDGARQSGRPISSAGSHRGADRSPSVDQSLTKSGTPAGKHRRRQMRIRAWWAIPAVAALVIVAFLFVPQPAEDPLAQVDSRKGAADSGGELQEALVSRPDLKQPPKSQGFVARILAVTDDTAWKVEGAANDFLMRLSTGDRIKVTSGLLKLEFSSQAEIILHAPADLLITGPSSGRLYSGYLTGRSSDGSFSLRTPAAEVIDIGTAFGVLVDQGGNTDVSVFDGEVHVGPMPTEKLPESLYRLTRGMSARVDRQGFIRADMKLDVSNLQQAFPHVASPTLGASEISLIDVISGSDVGEHRLAGCIDPSTGWWGQPPWDQTKGVEPRSGRGFFVPAEWNPLVDGVFVPGPAAGMVQIDSSGHTAALPKNCGATWGPIWARRRIDETLDPLSAMLDQDQQGFWGSGTVTALLERLRWARDGLVGMHPNVGITFDLLAIREQWGQSVRRMRGISAHLERSHESSPLYPSARADFRVYVDGEIRYERLGFRRADGDAQFGIEIREGDRFLTLLATDGEGRNDFDHTVLIDPVLELATKK